MSVRTSTRPASGPVFTHLAAFLLGALATVLGLGLAVAGVVL